MVSHVLFIFVELLKVLLLLFLFLFISLLFLFLVVLLGFDKLLEFVKIIRDICVLHFYF